MHSGNLPENYTTAVVIWKLLQTGQSALKDLTASLRLYEVSSGSKSFPVVSSSTALKKLHREKAEHNGTAPSPVLYAVDESKGYIVVTVSVRSEARDRSGIVLSESA